MGLADTAELAVRIKLDNDLSPGLQKINGQLGKLDAAAGRAGRRLGSLGRGLKTAGALAGGAIVGGLIVGIKSGLEDLATLESAVTSVDGAVKQLGLTGKVTGAQVATWANEIEHDIGAAFDDKDITAATTTLLRFGKVVPENLRPAMVIMTDLATKTGSVDSAASLLAKALADPTKAAGKLSRVGIVLTKAQQAQIKAFVKAGKVGKAQKVILDALTESTKGAAAASQGKYARALSVLADASEDAKKALAEGFLPVIEKVAGKLSDILADPKAVQSIRDFGTGLANAFDSVVDFAEKIPWGTIANGLKTSAEWAAKLFDAFRNLPPEVQTTLIALAGLNKLSGGAITGIVSELGKGLIKGVLGMTAGIVNINAGVVNGGGGIPGGASGEAGAAGGVLGTVKSALGVILPAALAVGVGAAMKEGFKNLSETLFPPELAHSFQEVLRIVNPLVGVATTIENLPGDIATAIKGLGNFFNPPKPGLSTPGGGVGQNAFVKPALSTPGGGVGQQAFVVHNDLKRLESLEQKLAAAKQAGDNARAQRLQAKIDVLKSRMDAAKQAINESKNTMATKLGAANVKLDAIRHKRTNFHLNTYVNVKTSVSVSEFQRQARYGSRVARTTSLSAS